jgi:hypothetical protein
MDLATFTRESTLNRQAYDQLRDHIQSTYAGRYVALAHGQLIGTASSFDEARAQVQRLQPVPEYYLVFPANEAPDFGLVYDLVQGV